MFENLNVTGTVWGCVKEFLGDKHHDCQISGNLFS
jgi:hypothetical protein